MIPLITVVIPVYNVRPYIEKCLKSSVLSARKCFEKTGRTVELICVDDGATDGTSVFLDEFEKNTNADGVELKVVHQPNGGVSAARNHGLALATGEWIHFLDADDWVSEDLYSQLFVRILESPDVDMIAFVNIWLYESGEVVKRMGAGLPSVKMTGDQLLASDQYASFTGCPGNRIFRRLKIEQAKLRFQIGVQPTEDDLFNMLFLSCNVKVRICTDIDGYYYRMNPTSSIHTMNIKKMVFRVNQFHVLYHRWQEIKTPGLAYMLVRIAKDCVLLGKRSGAEDRCQCVEALLGSWEFCHEVIPFLLRMGDCLSRMLAIIFVLSPLTLRRALLLRL